VKIVALEVDLAAVGTVVVAVRVVLVAGDDQAHGARATGQRVGQHAFHEMVRWSILHDGRATTVDEAIRAHGGEAAKARAAYAGIGERRADLELYLATLTRTPRMTWLR
jgi:CxxC motif-containing protein (DUF1111 family)